MPDLDGLSVIRSLPAEAAPIVILVTAFADHAIEAFEVRAFDYVLKPIDKDRFARALRDARAAIVNKRMLAKVGQLSALDADPDPGATDRFTHLRIRAGDRMLRLPVSSVRYFEASSQYVQADFGAGAHLLSTESLGSLEAKLAADVFFRVHRSYLVNSTFVEAVTGSAQDGLFALLTDGRRIPVSRRSRAIAEQLMLRIGERFGGA
jgi:two-component system LytT family response regulator